MKVFALLVLLLFPALLIAAPPNPTVTYTNGNLEKNGGQYTFVALWNAGIPFGTRVPLTFASPAIQRQAQQLVGWRVWIRGIRQGNSVQVTAIGPNR